MTEYSASIDIEAPPGVVFAHLVTADGMVAWMGQHAELNPTPGGRFAVDIGGAQIRGSYLEVDPPHRVVVSWGWEGSDDFPPGSSRVDFTLTASRMGTRLDLVHSGLPDPRAQGHAAGWDRYLARLRVAAAGTDPGADSWAIGKEAGMARR
ncbi:MAG: SRPBCC family protein [Chloroflexota bacterium]